MPYYCLNLQNVALNTWTLSLSDGAIVHFQRRGNHGQLMSGNFMLPFHCSEGRLSVQGYIADG